MTMTFQLSADELDEQIIHVLKTLYGRKIITLTVQADAPLSENERRIIEASQSKDGYVFKGDEFEKISQAMLKGEPVDFEKFRVTEKNKASSVKV
jgi:hypothetical protein